MFLISIFINKIISILLNITKIHTPNKLSLHPTPDHTDNIISKLWMWPPGPLSAMS